jgi:hypothetical protein
MGLNENPPMAGPDEDWELPTWLYLSLLCASSVLALVLWYLIY